METQQQLKLLSEAKSASGGTSLITMCIPSKYKLGLVVDKLVSELSTASNIKDKNVRKDVISALKSSIVCVKSCREAYAPENGYVLCAGEIKCCS